MKSLTIYIEATDDRACGDCHLRTVDDDGTKMCALFGELETITRVEGAAVNGAWTVGGWDGKRHEECLAAEATEAAPAEDEP